MVDIIQNFQKGGPRNRLTKAKINFQRQDTITHFNDTLISPENQSVLRQKNNQALNR